MKNELLTSLMCPIMCKGDASNKKRDKENISMNKEQDYLNY